MATTSYREEPIMYAPVHEEPPAPAPVRAPPSNPPKKMIGPDGKERAVSLGYCDFCLGDASENKKTREAEELVSCAECGRSGKDLCFFTDGRLFSAKTSCIYLLFQTFD